jgi:hypothetical protein
VLPLALQPQHPADQAGDPFRTIKSSVPCSTSERPYVMAKGAVYHSSYAMAK